MNPNILAFLFLLAGITLAFAAINLTIGLQKGGEKTYLFLGLIGVCVGIYYLLFPQLTFETPLPLVTRVGFFFFLTNFALLPWFFGFFTGYHKPILQWILTLGMALSYLLLNITGDFSKPIYWNIIGHVFLMGIILYGFKSGIFHKRHGQKWSAFLLLVAMVVFLILTIDDIIRMHFPSVYPFNVPENFLPLDYFLILFMIVMGLKLVHEIQLRYNFEKSMNVQEKRWGNLLGKVELLVVGLNPDGKVNYVNPFFLKISNYSENEILGKDWFSNFLPPSNRNEVFEAFQELLKKNVHSHFHNSIKTKEGHELTVSWSNVVIEDEQGNVISSLSIGSNITEQEQAFREIETLKSRLEEENILLKAELGKLPSAEKIIGKSDAIRYVLQRSLQVAPTDSTVLLEGETGVGKELIANYIQQNSTRAKSPFIKINCAAIPASLLESELFGHLKGAFTDANKNKKGLVEMADGGTLFLDEIGEFPLELQPKLLRFIQEGEFNPLGSETARKVDVRIIAATNRELLNEIDKGRFRNDLYYRLYVYPITIPALRNRAEDIPELVNVFLKRISMKHGKLITKISKLVFEELKKYAWPGNVRELENVIERAVIVSNSDTIKIKDINPGMDNKLSATIPKQQKIVPLEEAERRHILKALKQTNWQIHGNTGAAELLGINPSTLRSRIKKLNINKT